MHFSLASRFLQTLRIAAIHPELLNDKYAQTRHFLSYKEISGTKKNSALVEVQNLEFCRHKLCRAGKAGMMW